MSTSRLKLYNDALIICGERTLNSSTGLTENREPRYLLDHVWDNDGVKHCLEAAQWKFAMRTIRIDYDPSIEPEFGYRRAFEKPSDWCLTSALCSDESFNAPLLQYFDEAGYWYADLDELYVRYVSDDSAYGGDLSRWTARFANYAATYFASRIILKLTSDENKQDRILNPRNGRLAVALREAKSVDAMSDPTKFPPPGGWTKARLGGRNRGDRGNRNQFTE